MHIDDGIDTPPNPRSPDLLRRPFLTTRNAVAATSNVADADDDDGEKTLETLAHVDSRIRCALFLLCSAALISTLWHARFVGAFARSCVSCASVVGGSGGGLKVVVAMLSPCSQVASRVAGRAGWAPDAAHASGAEFIAHYFIMREEGCDDATLQAEANSAAGSPGDVVILQTIVGAPAPVVLLAAIRHVAAHADVDALLLLHTDAVLDIDAVAVALSEMASRHGLPLPALLTGAAVRSGSETERWELLTNSIRDAELPLFIAAHPARFFSRKLLTSVDDAARAQALRINASRYDDIALAIWLNETTVLASGVIVEPDAGALLCSTCRDKAGARGWNRPWVLRSRSPEDAAVATTRINRDGPLVGTCCKLRK